VQDKYAGCVGRDCPIRRGRDRRRRVVDDPVGFPSPRASHPAPEVALLRAHRPRRKLVREETRPADDELLVSPSHHVGLVDGTAEQPSAAPGLDDRHALDPIGVGDERDGEIRNFQFGDEMSQINMSESLKNAQINHGISDLHLTEDDLIVDETKHKAQMSTVLMIDISHSMILYGEDRITPAKKVAMALVELIRRKYPKDAIDIIVFGNESWSIKVKDLPYLQVGPYHTNTVAGLELAMDILRRKRNTNKQIFMITDGKPSCVKLPTGELYKNSNGLDEYIVSKCLNMAAQARKLKISITTFMIAQDPYLRQFVERFTAENQGKAFLTGLSDLGQMIFEDYEKNRIKRI
jgi:uncharacterized protein with von Willebrand factor type A (vWA) domain